VIGVQSRITVIHEGQDFPFQYKAGTPAWVFQMLKITARALIYMAVHPCKRGELLGACEN
jgi:hypothetical protein